MGLFDIPYITKQGRAEQKLAQMIENRWAAERAEEYEMSAAGNLQKGIRLQAERERTQKELYWLLTKFEKTQEDKKRIRTLKARLRLTNFEDRMNCSLYHTNNYLAEEERRNSRRRNWYNPF
jgi:hypothetical protein